MADPEPRMPRSSEKTTPKLKYTSFVEGISDADGEKSENLSLQEAFRIYREAKQDEIRKDRLIRKRRELRKANPQQMAALRQKFVDQAKKYYGYPYARKYWPPDSPEYKSKLFLDCCGLVRQVMKDLAEDFGFIIGPWNQAYMFDTLPINVEHEREMKPGDLVFVSATYNNPKSRKQRHNMTHVEIWAGEGKKTIGSRWNNGKVQLWDSYKFNAKSYHSELYHFKSIDTWLTGVCKSYCKEHRWKKYKYCPKKKSIFALPDQQQDAAGNDELKRSKTFSEEISGVSRLVAQCKRELRERPKTDMGIAASKSADCIFNDDQAYMDKDQFPAITNDLREFPQQLSPSRAKRNQKSKTSEFRNSGNSCLGKIENTEKMNKEMGSIGLLDDDSRRNLKSSPKTPIKSWSDPTMHGVRSDSVQKSLSQYDDIDEDDDDDEYDAQQGSDDDLYMEDEVTDEEQEQEETIVEVEKVTEVEKSTTEKGEKSTTGGVGKQTKDNVETMTKGDVQLSKNDLGSNNNGNETVDSFGTDLGAIILSKNSNSGVSKGTDKTAKSKADNGAKFMARGRSLNVGNFLENQRMLIKQGCVCGTDKDKGKEGPKAGTSGVKGGNGNGAVESPSTKKEDTKPVLIKRQLSDLRKKSITETTKTVAFAPVRGTNRNGNSNMSAVGKIGQGQGPDKVAGALGLSPRIKQTAHTQVPSKGHPRILTWDSESGRSNEGGESKKMAEERKIVIAKFPQGVEAENPSDPVEDTTGAESSKRGRGKKSPGGLKVTKLPACSLPSNMTPTFYVGGGNGVSLVEAPLVGMGWKRITDKFDEKFRLKWVECKSRINYACFREGEQLVNHLPNSHLLTNKLGLLNSLKEYERVTLSTKGRLPRLRMSDFHPETYKLDEKSDRDLFLEIYKDEIWICKPVGMNQGKGIFLIRSRAEIMQLLEEREQKKQQAQKPGRPLMNRIVQRYILNPLLLDGRKFDVRAYMLVASTVPFLILYHKGYIRLSCLKYDQDDSNLGTHLTNQFVQKKDPNYKDLKEDTAWSMDKFNTYINEHVRPDCPVEIEEDWAYNTFTKQMQKIMIHCFNSVKHKLQSRIGFFDLFGLDFMIDQEMKVHLIEVNTNPAIHCNCEALKEVIPAMVEETLYVSIECFEKSRKNQQLMPLSTLKNFTILYCGTKPNTNIPRQSRSVSPAKENTSEKPRLVPTGSLKRPTSPPRTGQRNLTQCTPLYAAGPQRRMLDKEKSDSSPSMNLSSAKSSHVAPISAKTTTTSIGGVHSGRGKLPDTDRDRKVVPIVCKEASNVNKTSIGKEKSNVEKGDVKGSKGDVKNEREKDGVGSGEATGDKTEGDSKKESESDVNKTETKPKPNVVIMDTLSRTTDSLNQATTALGRLSVSLNQMGLADSLLEEVRLKMTHSESLKNAANASGLSAGTNTGTSTGINTVTTTGTNTDATADSPGASNAATAKTSSARSTTRERENLERGN